MVQGEGGGGDLNIPWVFESSFSTGSHFLDRYAPINRAKSRFGEKRRLFQRTNTIPNHACSVPESLTLARN